MRLHLTLALITALLLVITLRSSQKHPFTFNQVQQLAQQRSQLAYTPLPDVLPPQLARLTDQQESSIFWKDSYRLWRKKGLPFQVDFYQVSKGFPYGPQIYTVDRKGSHPLAYSPSFFNFGHLTFDTPLPTTLPYAGFYLRYPLPTATEPKPNILNGFFSVQGVSYFRALAQDQVYGLSARAMAIDTHVDDKPEEFPEFTDWWLHQPAPDATSLTLDALLDSPSVTGAYEFKIHPGAVTSIDIHASLFFRKAVERFGIAPFSSMYLYGENAKNHYGDIGHPEIHDSDGLLLNKETGEWIWRPFKQSVQLQLYNFADENPKGFGLMQRDRDFQHYQDLDALYNVRPSVWVTPHGNWGKGVVQLTQLPSNNTNTDNLVVFWRPDQEPKAGDHLDLNYTIDFYMNDATRPPLAYCAATYVNDPAPPPAPPPSSISPPAPPSSIVASPSKLANGKTKRLPVKSVPPPPPAPKPPVLATIPVQFQIDFMGSGIENLAANTAPDVEINCEPAGTLVRESKIEKNSYDKLWRVTFTIIPFRKNVPTELHCRLLPHDSVDPIKKALAQFHVQLEEAQLANDSTKIGLLHKSIGDRERALKDAETKPLSETWTYTWGDQ